MCSDTEVEPCDRGLTEPEGYQVIPRHRDLSRDVSRDVFWFFWVFFIFILLTRNVLSLIVQQFTFTNGEIH